VGHARFYFLTEEAGATPKAPVTIADRDDEVLMSTETLHLDPGNSPYLQAQVGAEDPATLRRHAKDMSVLLRLNAEIHDIADSDALQAVLLQRVFESVPAENGVILLGNTVEQLVSGARLVREEGRPFYLSKTIVQQGMSSGRAVLQNDILAAGNASESLRTSG